MHKLPLSERKIAKEITPEWLQVWRKLPQSPHEATSVTNRFHLQKLACDAVQQVRADYRWQAIEQENLEMKLSKELGKTFISDKLKKGDSEKQGSSEKPANPAVSIARSPQSGYTKNFALSALDSI